MFKSSIESILKPVTLAMERLDAFAKDKEARADYDRNLSDQLLNSADAADRERERAEKIRDRLAALVA